MTSSRPAARLNVTRSSSSDYSDLDDGRSRGVSDLRYYRAGASVDRRSYGGSNAGIRFEVDCLDCGVGLRAGPGPAARHLRASHQPGRVGRSDGTSRRLAPPTSGPSRRSCPSPGATSGSPTTTRRTSSNPPSLHQLRATGVQGGVYLGVGPEQNLTYIAAICPAMAFIVDIRRQAAMQH